ncbi:cytochrome c biogenesis CcdA family protein [Patescibacteria group bacterium]
MVDINIPIAFFAGLVSFFAPCVLPLLPAYIGYVTGVSVKELQEKGYAPFRSKMITTSIMYILGFSVVFVLLGTAAAGVGGFLREYSLIIQRMGGLLILVLGLEFAGVLKIPFLARTKQFQLPVWSNKLGDLRAFFIGLVFATAWTPCVGAILGSILTLAAVSGTAVQGALLLFVYSLGISIPFLIVSLTLASAPKYLKVIQSKVDIISKISGMILAILGFLLLTNTYRFLNSWIFSIADKLGWTKFLVENL